MKQGTLVRSEDYKENPEAFEHKESDKSSYHKFRDLNVYCTSQQWEELKSEADELVALDGYDKEDALAELADIKSYGYNYGVKPVRNV